MRLSLEVDRLLQAAAEPAADGGPAPPLAILGDKPVPFGSPVQRMLNGTLVKRAGHDPAAQRPGSVVERIVPARSAVPATPRSRGP
jgi:hypothetical protein